MLRHTLGKSRLLLLLHSQEDDNNSDADHGVYGDGDNGQDEEDVNDAAGESSVEGNNNMKHCQREQQCLEVE